MNCKPGDLAVVLPGAVLTPELVNMFVVVERRAVVGEANESCRFWPFNASDVGWIVRSAVAGVRIPVRTTCGELRFVHRRAVLDRLLRPIRDNDGEDETLQWAGKPEQVTA